MWRAPATPGELLLRHYIMDVTLMTPRDLEERFIAGDKEASLAIEMFCYQVAKTLASYIVPLGGWVLCTVSCQFERVF